VHTVDCPACRATYKVRRAIDARGARISCPACNHEWIYFPDGAALRFPDGVLRSAELTLPEARIRSVTQRIDLPGLALPDSLPPTRLSDAEVPEAEAQESATIVVSGAIPAPPPVGVTVAPESPATRTDPTLRSQRSVSVQSSAALARRLLEEERIVPERFRPAQDTTAPARFALLGGTFAVFGMLALLLVGAVGWRLFGPTVAPVPPVAAVPVPIPAAPPLPEPAPRIAEPEVAAAPPPLAEPDQMMAASAASPEAPRAVAPAPPKAAPPKAATPKAAPPKAAPPKASRPEPAATEPPPPAPELAPGSDLVDPWK
jgi:predicted Zn finger-like uncharacterized protein